MTGSPSFLICCEHSGVVREAMRLLGIDAYSCDLLPSDDNSPFHIQGDCRIAMIGREWDGFGMHPDCTFLTGSGIHWNDRGRGWGKTNEALEFVNQLVDLAGDKPWYLENPVGIISTKTNLGKPAQIIQPYEFGDDASKKTCLWIGKFKPLEIDPSKRFPGRIVEWPKGSGKMVERWSNQTDSGQNRLGPSDDRWKQRSKTYQGIADAMADQWSSILKS